MYFILFLRHKAWSCNLKGFVPSPRSRISLCIQPVSCVYGCAVNQSDWWEIFEGVFGVFLYFWRFIEPCTSSMHPSLTTHRVNQAWSNQLGLCTLCGLSVAGVDSVLGTLGIFETSKRVLKYALFFCLDSSRVEDCTLKTSWEDLLGFVGEFVFGVLWVFGNQIDSLFALHIDQIRCSNP